MSEAQCFVAIAIPVGTSYSRTPFTLAVVLPPTAILWRSDWWSLSQAKTIQETRRWWWRRTRNTLQRI